MVIIAGLIIEFSYLFEIPRTVKTKVYFKKEIVYTIVDFDQINEIKEGMTVFIKTPFKDNPIKGGVVKSKMWAEKDKVFIPLSIDPTELKALSFKNELICNGEIFQEKSSLFSKVFSRKMF